MQAYLLLAVATIIAICLDFAIIRIWKHYNHFKKQYTDEKLPFSKTGLLKAALAETVNNQFFYKLKKEHHENHQVRGQITTILELAFLAFIAIVITQPYLDFNKTIIPAGHELSSVTQNHHLWTRAQECGICAVWNGSIGGGFPAFVDLHGSALHPIIIVTTLLWGVVNGTKVALLISFWMAGVAQWWLAKELKVGTLARLWTAALAITGGHLTSRMQLGTFGLVLSTALASFVFAALIAVIQNKNRKSVVLLAISLASVILSGQGYIQVGLVFTAPAVLFLIWDDRFNQKLWKNFMQGIVIAFLLAAPFLIPLMHFSSQIIKWEDPKFTSVQPITFAPLNLVIDDREYYFNQDLQKAPYPYLNAHFIGWVPVALAVLGLSLLNRDNRRYIFFFLSGIVLVFLASSAISLKWAAYIYPGISGLRYPSVISGLAIPLILGLSAYGIEKILNLKWPNFWLGMGREAPERFFSLPVKLILLTPFLLFGLRQTYQFSTHWIYTNKNEPAVFELIDALQTASLTWVNPPFGEHRYVEPAIAAGLKLSPGIIAWRWAKREIPLPRFEALRGGPPADNPVVFNIVDGAFIYLREWEYYASVASGDEIIPCMARGTGGRITIECDTPSEGILTVKENMWSGWVAWQDGKRIELQDYPFLQVKASVGKHTYQFEYLPWDVPLGIILSFAGIFVCIWMWRIPEQNQNAGGL